MGFRPRSREKRVCLATRLEGDETIRGPGELAAQRTSEGLRKDKTERRRDQDNVLDLFLDLDAVPGLVLDQDAVPGLFLDSVPGRRTCAPQRGLVWGFCHDTKVGALASRRP